VATGLVIDHESDANFVPLDTADNWLHFGLGVGMIALGLLLPAVVGTRGTPRRSDPARPDTSAS